MFAGEKLQLMLAWENELGLQPFSLKFHQHIYTRLFKNGFSGKSMEVPFYFQAASRRYCLLLNEGVQQRNSPCDSSCPAEHQNTPVPHRRKLALIEADANAQAEFAKLLAESRLVQLQDGYDKLSAEEQDRLARYVTEFTDCPICLNSREDLVTQQTPLVFSSKCLHLACSLCMMYVIETNQDNYTQTTCPICRTAFTKDDIIKCRN